VNRRRLIALAAVTVAVAIGAAVTAHYHAPQTSIEKTLFMPGLRDKVNDVAELRLEGKGKTITLIRAGENWGIAEADGYPARFEKVKQLIVGTAGLRALDAKTSNPELYSRLGVEDPSERGSNSTLVVLKDTSGTVLAELIAGHDRKSSAPGDQPGLYVRIPGQETAYLVEGRLEASMEIPDWLQRDVFSVSGDRIREIEIRRGTTDPVRLQRAQQHGELKLAGLPAGSPDPSQLIVDRMATVLDNMFIDSARAAAQVTFSDAASRTVVRTFDGLIISVTAEEIGGQPLAAFRFEHDPDAAVPAADAPEVAEGGSDDDTGSLPAEDTVPDTATEAEQLNARMDGWAFVVPRFKFDLLSRTLQDFMPAAGPGADPGDN